MHVQELDLHLLATIFLTSANFGNAKMWKLQAKYDANLSVVGCKNQHKILLPQSEVKKWINSMLDGNVPTTTGKHLNVCKVSLDLFLSEGQYKV